VKRPVLLVDNKDSFVFNLMDAFARLGAAVRVVRNTLTPEAVVDAAMRERSLVVLSPGPGRPEDAGNLLGIVAATKGRVPVFGVCLGLQAILLEAGARVERAPSIVHGKASMLAHDGGGLLRGVRTPFPAGRYHSLCVREVPSRFTVHAILDGMAMAVSDRAARQAAVQFHPESILTPSGDRILANLLGEA
jgi:anthranilate synthase/aminodeoxychorismate synthase-like glutamine amidotransferase